MDSPNFLGIGWWNTSLSPRGKPEEIPAERWSIAERVARALVEHDAVDILALGEVTPTDVGRLKHACSGVALRSVTDDRPLNEGGS
jgi:hypothetical protein